MHTDLAGKVALITGGASGIGAALAAELAGHGAVVWIADRQTAAAEEVAQRLRTTGAQAHAVALDVRRYPDFVRVAAEVVAESGRIDYLFNNAGIGIGGEVASLELSDWDDIIDVNLRGVVHGIHAVYPLLIGQRSGHIVNTASMAGLVTMTGQAGYTATKHAVVALSKTLRLEARDHGVSVSVLCPGVVRTPILTGGEYGRHRQVSTAELARMGEALRPITAEAFARQAVRQVVRNRAIIVVPRWWTALWWIERLSPALSMRLAAIALRKQRDASARAN